MKPAYLLLPIIIAGFFAVTGVRAAEPVPNPSCTLVSLLKIGVRGAEVGCLQEKVGAVKDGRFGPLTRAAVIVFQRNNGLAPDGIVGPLSRAVLNSTQANLTDNKNIPASDEPKKEQADISKDKAASDESNTNPNLAYLDEFVAKVVEVSEKYGKSEKEALALGESLRKEITKSERDYNKEFEQMLVREAAVSENSFLDQIFAKMMLALVKPARAEAGLPFGGMLLSTFFCPASENWIIYVTPLPPSYIALLSYTPGTQGFASYNIPFTRYLLGQYTPVGLCSFGYVNIPTEGIIQPMTGSSPSM